MVGVAGSGSNVAVAVSLVVPPGPVQVSVWVRDAVIEYVSVPDVPDQLPPASENVTVQESALAHGEAGEPHHVTVKF